ncbi:hypothetical protein [Sulfurospirillum sp. 1612]|uniref:hypothetical protein n=1 Tax=Sulfurospirillum sp. 1612 TaxID=3094835 RepID=UPI002F9301F1
MNRIIYKNKDESVAILIPAQEVLDIVGLQAIAEKDVPHNLPYWLVSDTDIPTDRTDRDRWVLEDMPEPDGFGGESSEFTDTELQALYRQGVIK